MTSSKTLFWLGVAFVLGVALQSAVQIDRILIWFFLVSAVFLILILFAGEYLKISGLKASGKLGFFVLFFVLGILRLQAAEFKIENDQLRKINDSPQKITLTGQIIDGPDVRDNLQKLKVRVDGYGSLVLVTVSNYPEYKYLDTIKFTGKLKTPAVSGDFNYKNYLMKDGIYSVMDFPKVELVSQNRNYSIFTFLYGKILLFKEKMKKSIVNNFQKPQSLVLEGIILGDNKNMTQDLRDKLNGVGLRYLTAISGVHVVILSSILMSFFLILGFWRGQAFYLSLGFIWLYIILTAMSASGVRAAIMGSIFLLAEVLGRQNTSSRTIMMAAFAMLFLNPLLLFYDAGFQLSFLASLGIIYLKPVIENFLQTMADRLEAGRLFINKKIHNFMFLRLKYLISIISLTVTAQIFTAPIMVYSFKNVSLVAPITNVLIVPVVYWLILFGFLSAVLGTLPLQLGGFLGWVFYLPCRFLLAYFLKITDIFYQPWSVKTIVNVSWLWIAVYYFILAFLILYFKKIQKQKFLGY